MTMTRSAFLSLMAEGLRDVFFEQYNAMPMVYKDIYDVKSSKKRKEDYQDIVGIGMLDQKDEGESITYADASEGYTKSFIHTSWAKGIRATRELIDDDQYSVIAKRSQLLARSANYRKEYEHAKLFNNATATTYFTGQDTLALLSTAHTCAGSGANFSNYSASTALSVTSLDTAFAAIRRYTDENGLLINLEPAVLLIPPELERTAYQILNSTGLSGTANNDANWYKGRLKVVTWKFITDTDRWFVLVPKSDLAPISFDRVAVEFERDSDFDTKDLKMSAYTRFSNGFINPRFCYGGQAA